MSGTMKACRLHEYGGPEIIRYEDAPIPVPADGEVLIPATEDVVKSVDIDNGRMTIEAVKGLLSG